MTEKSVSLHFGSEAQLRFKQWDGENTGRIDQEQNEGLRSHFGKYLASRSARWFVPAG